MLKSIPIPVTFIMFCSCICFAQANSIDARIDAYLQPYAQSGNFSGVVLVERGGRVIFEKAYGFADREHQVRNISETRFHIASLSGQFTAAAVFRLVDTGSLSLDERVGKFVPDIEGADKITVRDLLIERSGLPDINSLPDYDDILQHHQTPSSLIVKIAGKPLLFEPGTKFLHEEHSAYNLLALIAEKKSGLTFATAVERLVFEPAGLAGSGIDDDSPIRDIPMAKGYEPVGTDEVKPAAVIHWSAKTGNASAYTTAADEARWVRTLFSGRVLSEKLRNAVLDTSMEVGYGWFKGANKRFDETSYYMNGRAPGFASFLLYLPTAGTTVVVLSNIYSSVPTTIGYDVAAISLGLIYQPFIVRVPHPDSTELKSCTGTFQFGADFYQANAKVALATDGQVLSLRWPSGSVSALIPVDRDHFVDRSYWVELRIERDKSGKPIALTYGQFRGTAL